MIGVMLEQEDALESYQLDVAENNGYPHSAQLVQDGSPVVSAEVVVGSEQQVYDGRQLVSVSSINRTTGKKGTGKLLYAMLANWCLEHGMALASHSGSVYADGKFRPQETRTGAATSVHLFMKRYGVVEVDVPSQDEYSDAVAERMFVYERPIPIGELIDELGLR